MMEARKHLVQYLHGFPNVKEYRTRLVHVESPNEIIAILDDIRVNHHDLLDTRIGGVNAEALKQSW